MTSTPKRLNILFTSAGRRCELLRAFRDAYGALGLAGAITAVDANPLAPALKIADRNYIVPRAEKDDYVATLLRLCRQDKIDLIFPLTDPELPLFACHRDAFLNAGARLVLSAERAVTISTDKWLTKSFFAHLNLATPESWLPGKDLPDPMRFPLFIKPREGSGSSSCFEVRNQRELDFFTTYVPAPILSEMLPGPEITSDVVCDLHGKLLAVVSRRRIEVRGGEVAKGVTVFDQRINDACVAIARELALVGPITVQCMMKDGVPHFTEINARFGGGVPLSIAAGADFPRWLLADAAGLDIPIPPVGSYTTGLYMTRFDDSHFITETGREQLAGRCI